MGKIKILEKSVALKIAAGEVIDRPASVLRELLDNSIDAGSSEISVHIESAGIKELRIVDNGIGMDEEDLKLSVMQHATSKIESIEDLFNIHTLGFRGEALSSIAASSRLEIITGKDETSIGKMLKTDSDGKIAITTSASRKGTTVSVKDLFYAIPARKQFLKNPSAETNLCKNIFYEKAAARPDIAFKLYIDGALIQMLNRGTLGERIFDCYSAAFRDKVFLYEIGETDYGRYNIKGVIADPAIFRKDRKFIHIYLNGRRIQEYSLIQAVTYGFSEFMPGGHFPTAFIFIKNDPSLVDFNIHPAKKEAKIKNIQQIHHSITDLIKRANKNNSSYAEINTRVKPSPAFIDSDKDSNSFSAGLQNKSMGSFFWEESNNQNNKNLKQQNFINNAASRSVPRLASQHHEAWSNIKYAHSTVFDKHHTYRPSKHLKGVLPDIEQDYEDTETAKYLGQLFNIFLLCEKNDSLYIIDQHAAHEKSIYESLLNKKTETQRLLVPLYLPEDITLTPEVINDYKKTGIIIEKDDTEKFFIDSLPDILSNIKNDIIAVINKSPGNIDEVQKKLFSAAACKKAIKAGDILSDIEAKAIIEAAFSLKSPYCPHGRPIWKRIMKTELLEQINRIL
ncbi:MAG: DNA mismatch repair endonuclease MutL [Spirochaetes bacterium]|nr:DNA mismatch repair endonuclease MutL [Spirochaetota bacterium]